MDEEDDGFEGEDEEDEDEEALQSPIFKAKPLSGLKDGAAGGGGGGGGQQQQAQAQAQAAVSATAGGGAGAAGDGQKRGVKRKDMEAASAAGKEVSCILMHIG